MILKELAKLLSSDCYCYIREKEYSTVLLDIGSLKNIADDDLLYAKVIDFCSSDYENEAVITVKKYNDRHTLREISRILDPFERVNICVIHDDGSKEMIVEDSFGFILCDEYYDYLVKSIELIPYKNKYMIVEIDAEAPTKEAKLGDRK